MCNKSVFKFNMNGMLHVIGLCEIYTVCVMYESETYLFDCPIYSNIEPSNRCFDNFQYVVNVSENLLYIMFFKAIA